MILIKNVMVQNPKSLGIKDVLIAGEKIVLIEDNISAYPQGTEIINGDGKILIPGLIDQHVHITGGGGEGGFKTRVPEMQLSQAIKAGVTTVVGLLGTDSDTRNMENLVGKAKGLKAEGLSVYLITGSYDYPTKTLTGSVRKDLIFIEEIVGAKVALSDHRAPQIKKCELLRLASDVRVAGMISGKAGILVLHMGNGKNGLMDVLHIIEETDIPSKTFRPTHMNRKRNLLLEGFQFAKKLGYIDLTSATSKDLTPDKVIQMAKEEKVPLDRITVSSDGFGSWSKYDQEGKMIDIGVAKIDTLWSSFVKVAEMENGDLEKALPYFTSNVAKALQIESHKGFIDEGKDADLILLNKDLEKEIVMAKGKIMFEKGMLMAKGTYE